MTYGQKTKPSAGFLTRLYQGVSFRTMPDAIEYAFEAGIITPLARRVLGWWSRSVLHRQKRLISWLPTTEVAIYLKTDRSNVLKAVKELIDLGIFHIEKRGSRGEYCLALNIAWRHDRRAATPRTPCITDANRGYGTQNKKQETPDSQCFATSCLNIKNSLETVHDISNSYSIELSSSTIDQIIYLADTYQARIQRGSTHEVTSLKHHHQERRWLAETLSKSMDARRDYPPVAPEVFACALRVAYEQIQGAGQRPRRHIWRIARGICINWWTMYRINQADQLPQLQRIWQVDGDPKASWDLKAFYALKNPFGETLKTESLPRAQKVQEQSPQKESDQDAGALKNIPEPLRGSLTSLHPLLTAVLSRCAIELSDAGAVIKTPEKFVFATLNRHQHTITEAFGTHGVKSIEIILTPEAPLKKQSSPPKPPKQAQPNSSATQQRAGTEHFSSVEALIKSIAEAIAKERRGCAPNLLIK